ncbi:MAG: alanine racemase [Actinomycetota bacterium]|nr:alanine racemase [Actinomycetota bacterium]
MTAVDGPCRAWAEIDLDGVAHNVRVLRARAAPAAVCAVVKANGYGHGAVPVARAALDAGAERLGIATATEAVELRDAGIDAPIILFSEPRSAELDAVLACRVEPTVFSPATIAALAERATRRPAGAAPVPVHLKVDTGMNRIGAEPHEAVALARAVAAEPALRLASVWTHCAGADDPAHDGYTATQLDRFDEVLAALDAAGLRPPLAHAGNSAVAIAHPRGRHDLVRCGISIYGIPPSPLLDGLVDLRPAMTLVAEVTHVKDVDAGESISYGLTHTFDAPTRVATIAAGYADGVPRRLGNRGHVLVGGRRCPVVGVVTMDQLMVDIGGPGAGGVEVSVGDRAVLVGSRGAEAVTADDWAAAAGTISYEIVTRIGPRVRRVHRGP